MKDKLKELIIEWCQTINWDDFPEDSQIDELANDIIDFFESLK